MNPYQKRIASLSVPPKSFNCFRSRMDFFVLLLHFWPPFLEGARF